MFISYKGFNTQIMTFENDTEIKMNAPVTLDESGKLVPAKAGESFIGCLVSRRNGTAAVQMVGYMEIPFTGTTPKYGYNRLVANGNGGVVVSTDENAPLYRVLYRSNEAGIAGVILS